MSLFEHAVAASNNAELSKMNVRDEIINAYADYVKSQSFQDYIKGRLDSEALNNRMLKIYVEFWEYHEGCSGTHFRCGGWRWRNPDVPEYSYEGNKYKGVRLLDIQLPVVEGVCDVFKNAMREEGFSNISIIRQKNNLGYADYEVVVRW